MSGADTWNLYRRIGGEVLKFEYPDYEALTETEQHFWSIFAENMGIKFTKAERILILALVGDYLMKSYQELRGGQKDLSLATQDLELASSIIHKLGAQR